MINMDARENAIQQVVALYKYTREALIIISCVESSLSVRSDMLVLPSASRILLPAKVLREMLPLRLLLRWPPRLQLALRNLQDHQFSEILHVLLIKIPSFSPGEIFTSGKRFQSLRSKHSTIITVVLLRSVLMSRISVRDSIVPMFRIRTTLKDSTQSDRSNGAPFFCLCS